MPTSSRTPDRSPNPGRVLVVDDDRRMASGMAQWLCGTGWHASAAGTADEAIQLISRGRFDACVIDGLLPDGAADRLMAVVRAASPTTGVVIALPPQPIDRAMDHAADAVTTVPVQDADLVAAIERACAAARARGAEEQASVGRALLGSHPSIRQVLDIVDRIADTPATVLITGESGTGKSLVAREIHRAGRRRDGRFVEVACGSLSESLLESELFGHVAGAFTGASADRDGKFLQADGGTIFLDEIATASPAMQVKMLRVLQDFQFEPVGGSQTHSVDARVILATHENLEALVAAGRFRADLFWRINVVAIEMPALRNRSSDIPLLAMHFLSSAAAKAGRRVDGFTAAALDALLEHSWPGNVRELEHAVERAVFLGRGQLVDISDLPPAVARGGATAAASDATVNRSLKSAMAHPERQLIIDALKQHGWRRDAAAKSLGINRTTLYKKLKRLGMDLAALEPR
jgi:DNA-binding NtrC family response regulator